MRLHRLARFALAATLTAAPLSLSAAGAATPAEVKAGMQVVDPAGGAVGTVTSVTADNLVLKTDKHELALPLSSFTASEGKLLFGMTAAELNAEADKQLAAAQAAVAVGAQVYGSDGTLAGQIEAIDTEFVTIKLSGGEIVRLPRSGVGGSDKGAVVGITTAELGKLASQAAPGTASVAATDEAASE
jgi:preprotein translocase subunit YajC